MQLKKLSLIVKSKEKDKEVLKQAEEFAHALSKVIIIAGGILLLLVILLNRRYL